MFSYYLIQIPVSMDTSAILQASSVRQAIEYAQEYQINRLALDKAWQGIHFVLSSELPIPCFELEARGIKCGNGLENVLMGGVPTHYKDSFGAARFISAERVKEQNQLLQSKSVSWFIENYDPKWLSQNQIAPFDWSQREHLDYLVSHFKHLQTFYDWVAKNQNGLISYLA